MSKPTISETPKPLDQSKQIQNKIVPNQKSTSPTKSNPNKAEQGSTKSDKNKQKQFPPHKQNSPKKQKQNKDQSSEKSDPKTNVLKPAKLPAKLPRYRVDENTDSSKLVLEPLPLSENKFAHVEDIEAEEHASTSSLWKNPPKLWADPPESESVEDSDAG
jgi:hypothetical protein